jgi:hypothetical protein
LFVTMLIVPDTAALDPGDSTGACRTTSGPT